MLKLAYWMHRRYFTTLSRCIQTITPSGIKDKTDYYKNIKYIKIGDNFADSLIKYENSKKSEKKRLILKYVLENGEMPLSVLRNSINSADYAIKTLREEKALEVYDKKVLAEPYINSLKDVYKRQVSGSIAVAIGLGAQNLVSDMISGCLLYTSFRLQDTDF